MSKHENSSSGSKVTTILVKVESKKKRNDFPAEGLFYHDGDHILYVYE